MGLPALDFDAMQEEKCCVCGIRFAMTSSLRSARLADGHHFYCPNGHAQHFTDSYKQQLERAQAALTQEKAARWSAADRANRAEGRLHRLKGRLQAGKCPKCSQRFPDLARHLKQKHPRLNLNRAIH